MGFANRMSDLLDVIENHLGTEALNLPEKFSKDKWADKVIIKDTLTVFSRYVPHKIVYQVVPSRDKSPHGDYYLIDENIIPGNVEIIGIRDYKWDDPNNGYAAGYGEAYGIQDMYSHMYDLTDIGMAQSYADCASLFSNGLYVDFEPPNKFFICNAMGTRVNYGNPFTIEVFVKHAPTLLTISPTQMGIFEKLAEADVASYLYNNLKYYDGLETVFGNNIDLKLDDLRDKASRRDEIENELKDSYVSAGNRNQPIMYTVY